MNETMNETNSQNWAEASNRMMNLWSETYSTWLNTWVWSSQRVLEFNKMLATQLETTQQEGRKYAEELSQKARQNSQVMQEVMQDGVKTYSANLNGWRATTESNADELNRRVAQMQQQFEAASVN